MNIYVGNISFQLSESDLESAFDELQAEFDKLMSSVEGDDAEEEADMDDMEDEMEESEEVVAEAAELKPVPAPKGGASEGSSPVASGGKASNDAHEPGAMSSGSASEGKKPNVKVDQQTTEPDMKKV